MLAGTNVPPDRTSRSTAITTSGLRVERDVAAHSLADRRGDLGDLFALGEQDDRNIREPTAQEVYLVGNLGVVDGRWADVKDREFRVAACDLHRRHPRDRRRR